MAEPFLSEIRVFSFNFAPKGWAQCNGQLLPINQNQALFALLGTTYGGNGQTNFALPNFQGAAAIHTGNGHTLGESAGTSTVTLGIAQMPQHTHLLGASAQSGDTPVPSNTVLASTPAQIYTNQLTNLTTLNPANVTSVGGSQPHDNMMPYLVLNYCIALQGIFPSPDLTEATTMAQPYVGELRQFAGNFAPLGWLFCDGQLLPIAENETLFQLIGTTYGGDGQETFALPDLRGRTALHMGTRGGITYPLAQQAGVEEVTLTIPQIPNHTHALVASTDLATQAAPQGSILAQSTVVDMYIQDSPDGALAATANGSAGGSQPHSNLQPYLCVNWIISQFGLFPSPT